jgi:hypothetical protein
MSLESKMIFSLADLVRETGIPYKFLTAIVEHHGPSIPCLMDGKQRRYTPDAIPVIARLWREYKASIKDDKVPAHQWYTDLMDHIRESSEKLADAASTLRTMRAELRKKPPHRIFLINTFPGGDLQPTRPIAVHVDTPGKRSRAMLIDADLEADGENDRTAVLNLREVIMRTFLRLEQSRTHEEEEQFAALSSLIRRS